MEKSSIVRKKLGKIDEAKKKKKLLKKNRKGIGQRQGTDTDERNVKGN